MRDVTLRLRAETMEGHRAVLASFGQGAAIARIIGGEQRIDTGEFAEECARLFGDARRFAEQQRHFAPIDRVPAPHPDTSHGKLREFLPRHQLDLRTAMPPDYRDERGSEADQV